MIRPCVDKSACFPCADENPISNYSSEAPDPVDFFCISYGSLLPAPIGSGCNTQHSPTVCVAETQEEACLCAERDAYITQFSDCPTLPPIPPNPPDKPQPPTPPPANFVCLSASASATSKCPDGLDFTFYIRAGEFAASGGSQVGCQILADRKAATYAQQQVLLNRVCMGPLVPTEATEGLPYAGEIAVTSANLI